MVKELRTVDLFRNLDPVQLAHLASLCQEVQLKKNQVLFLEGDAPEAFYVIVRGRIRISKVVPGIGEEALAILGDGAYFGEMEIIEPTPRAAQAVAHEASTLLAIKISDLHQVLGADRDLALALLWNFVRTLSERLRHTNDKVMATFAMASFG
jgi:CRP-like cAMP-binding protein